LLIKRTNVLLTPQVLTATPNHIVYVAGARSGATGNATTVFAERLPLFARDIKVRSKHTQMRHLPVCVQLLIICSPSGYGRHRSGVSECVLTWWPQSSAAGQCRP
jgi:hypothetical protein